MRKRRKSPTSEKSPDALVKQGDMHLAAGRYRDAIEVYKRLLKREQRPEWRDRLADAYLARAGQLADKGMYAEAVALWENMSNLCGTRKDLRRYIAWLIRAGRAATGARTYAGADESFRDSPEGQRLAALLAGLLVSGQREIAEALTADMPVVQQCDSVAAAMRAYCEGDDVASKEHLKRIPFRSPYRDLRLILQALSVLETDRQSARPLLDRIADDSPFARLATLVRTATLNGRDVVEAAMELPAAAREFVLSIKGWDAARIRLLDELQKLSASEARFRALFNFVCANRERFPAGEAQRFCLALVPDDPRAIAAYEKQFGALPVFERERLSALTQERRGNLEGAVNHWLHCVEHLTRAAPQGDEALQAALILRHVAKLGTRLYGPDPWNEAVAQHLSRSLELDPQDKETYLQLMEMDRRRGDHKAHDRRVEQAVRYLPEDADILMAAGLAAYRREAFKKAARFAQDLLQRDPINHPARNLLLSCHLGAARKQASSGRSALAARELDTALLLARDDEQQGVVELNQGFLALLSDSQDRGEALLRQAYRHLGGSLIAYFRFLVDGQRLGFEQRALEKHYAAVKDKREAPATQKDILLLVDLIHRYSSDGVKGLSGILERLRRPLKTAAGLDYGEKELRAICAALQRAGHHLLLRDFAEAGLKRWGQHPVFVYYSVFARAKGRSERITSIDAVQLQGALDRAIDQEDHETAARIEDFLGLPAFGLGGLPMMPPDLAQGFGAVLEDIMDALGSDDFEEALDFFEEKLRKTGLPRPTRPKGRRR